MHLDSGLGPGLVFLPSPLRIFYAVSGGGNVWIVSGRRGEWPTSPIVIKKKMAVFSAARQRNSDDALNLILYRGTLLLRHHEPVQVVVRLLQGRVKADGVAQRARRPRSDGR